MVGLAASESDFDLDSLFRVILNPAASSRYPNIIIYNFIRYYLPSLNVQLIGIILWPNRHWLFRLERVSVATENIR